MNEMNAELDERHIPHILLHIEMLLDCCCCCVLEDELSGKKLRKAYCVEELPESLAGNVLNYEYSYVVPADE